MDNNTFPVLNNTMQHAIRGTCLQTWMANACLVSCIRTDPRFTSGAFERVSSAFLVVKINHATNGKIVLNVMIDAPHDIFVAWWHPKQYMYYAEGTRSQFSQCMLDEYAPIPSISREVAYNFLGLPPPCDYATYFRDCMQQIALSLLTLYSRYFGNQYTFIADETFTSELKRHDSRHGNEEDEIEIDMDDGCTIDRDYIDINDPRQRVIAKRHKKSAIVV